jgi:hypothetical protein
MKLPSFLQLIDASEFRIHEGKIAEEDVLLIQPELEAHWNKDNLIFRSSVWTKDGTLISAGFPKFFNYGEQAELSPPPTDISNAILPAKLDGSLCICSKYKGQLIIRTRGTFDAFIHENGSELNLLKERYPKIFSYDSETWNYSVLIEWVSPSNQIILKYPEVDFYLVGVVKHEDYSLLTQSELDVYAKEIGMKRPEIYKFKTITDLIESIKASKGIEGVVIYTNNGQTLHKLKSIWYLSLHRMKSLLGSYDKVYDVWLSFGKPSTYSEFYDKMVETFDYEIAEACKNTLKDIVENGIKTCEKLKELSEICEKLKELKTKKDQALEIQKNYKEWQTYLFQMLTGRELTEKAYKTLFYKIKGE